MNLSKAIYCRTVQAVLRAALPVLIVTEEGIVRSGIAGRLEAALDQRGVAYSVMAAHAEKEANLLYPVPRLMTKEELTLFYRQVAAGREVRHGKRAS